ncbi:AlkZ family DNA glycosylase [Dysgonomonas sp. Marseille-P4677]|uniref:winged helix DNA-binding domain-containing protein n=1 Tax=Dysgonomonas sp. Marseille-P4677 TaxID=2364790 RepID=UPI001912B2DB|nr:winged helix DNA-binding domain-containing protein [Dysgonomonas sp. Marseille-P4677]MBK5721289.1 AlkZ family DNA glycosylase [Dysgonomonas sp. Marseille-P4677]
MDATTIVTTRLVNQQLIKTDLKTPKEVVSWMGAIQAQDFNMAKWAVGVRLGGISDKQVEDAVNKGDIIRTHILRPTWHFVSSDDIYWMLKLTASRIKAAVDAYDKSLKLTPEIVLKTNLAITKLLEKEPHQTREELGIRLEELGIPINRSILTHIMYHAEQDGIVCNGIVRGKKQTYDLLENRIPKPSEISRDEALYRLAYKYFRSHGPATLQDFIWWSGLTATDARKAVESIRKEFIFEIFDAQTYILHDSCLNYKLDKDHIHFLPAFDELFISYKDRKESLALEHQKKVIVSNGVFKPTIFHNGKIIGIWNRVVRKSGVTAEGSLFFNPPASIHKLIKKASNEFDAFMK